MTAIQYLKNAQRSATQCAYSFEANYINFLSLQF